MAAAHSLSEALNDVGNPLIVAVISMLVFWRGKNAVGRGYAAGALVGSVVAIIVFSLGNGFDVRIVEKGAVCGILVGAVLEVVSRASKKK